MVPAILLCNFKVFLTISQLSIKFLLKHVILDNYLKTNYFGNLYINMYKLDNKPTLECLQLCNLIVRQMTLGEFHIKITLSTKFLDTL